MKLLCALCLRDPSTGPRGWHPGEIHAGYPGAPYEPEAVTIANGNALCQIHFERLSDAQNEVHGPPSIIALVARMHAPSDPPAQPWLMWRDA